MGEDSQNWWRQCAWLWWATREEKETRKESETNQSKKIRNIGFSFKSLKYFLSHSTRGIWLFIHYFMESPSRYSYYCRRITLHPFNGKAAMYLWFSLNPPSSKTNNRKRIDHFRKRTKEQSKNYRAIGVLHGEYDDPCVSYLRRFPHVVPLLASVTTWVKNGSSWWFLFVIFKFSCRKITNVSEVIMHANNIYFHTDLDIFAIWYKM